MGVEKPEKLDLLYQTRMSIAVAAEYIAGDSPFTKEAALRELEDAAVMITTVILAEKHSPEVA